MNISTAVDEESYTTTSCPDSLSGVGNVAGAKVTKQVDIFKLGFVLYLCTGGQTQVHALPLTTNDSL